MTPIADTAVNTARAALPVSVSAASVSGVDLQTWVYITTIGYTMLQAVYLLWKWRKERKGGTE